jgi:integrase
VVCYVVCKLAKGKGRHPINALTPLRVSKLSDPGRYTDGNGLYLVIDQSGAKRWVLRTVVKGRRRDMGLGGIRIISLAEARTTAQRYRAIARNGGDPFEERHRKHAVIPTFEEAAVAVHANLVPSWKNPKHAAQWIRTLEEYAFPLISQRPVSQISSGDVLRILSPIWLEKQETAKRMSQRISSVIKWARASGYFLGDDPVEAAKIGLPRQSRRVRRHASVDFHAVPELVEQLRKCPSQPISKLALEFLILTASRTKEVLEASWEEVDQPKQLWVLLPPDRTKTGQPHRVPLTERMVEILKEAQALSLGSHFIFANPGTGLPLSYNTLLHVLQKRVGSSATVHGFRSSFKDWAAETTTFSNEVSEMALSHKIANRVEAAYRRGDLLEKRRGMMAAWEDFIFNQNVKVVTVDFKAQG